MRRKHRMDIYYTGNTCSVHLSHGVATPKLPPIVAEFAQSGSLGGALVVNLNHEFNRSTSCKLRLGFVGTLVRALAPLPISGRNRRFCIPTLDLIFLQHGSLE